MVQQNQTQERTYLRLFQEVTSLITSTLDKDRVMHLIVSKVPEVVGVDAATIRLLNEEDKKLLLLAAHGLSKTYLDRGPVDMEPGVMEALAGTPVTVLDAATDPRITYSEAAEKEGIKSILMAPIPIRGRIRGILRLLTRKPRPYSDREVEFTAAIAEQCGVALENADAYLEQERQIQYFKTLNEIGRMLNSSQLLDSVLDVIVKRLPRVMKLKGCTIRLLSPSKGRLDLVAASGLSQTYLDRGSIDAELSTHQALQGKPVVIEDAVTDPRSQYREAAKAEGIVTILAVPIVVNSNTIGVLRLLTAESRSFSETEIDFTMAVAEQGGIAIQNALHYEKTLKMVTELEHQEDFLQQVIDNLDADLFVLDTDFHFVMINRVFLENHGMLESDVLGQPCFKILRIAESSHGEIRRVLTEERPVIFTQAAGTDEKRIYLEVSASPVPLYDRKAKADFIIGTIRDVTDHVQLQQEQRAREKLQGVLEMAGAAAHELNTPVFSALGTAQLLSEDMEGNESHLDDVKGIIRNLKTVSTLTRKMTRITRYEAKAYVDNTKIVDIEKSSAN
ncbi:MAG: GAF domain-containing protein [Thermodesulfobacteriota bacterium]